MTNEERDLITQFVQRVGGQPARPSGFGGSVPATQPALPPVDREATRQAALDRLGIRGRYLLVVGQNTPSKNHGAVLEAFAAARLPRDVSLVVLQRLYAFNNGQRIITTRPLKQINELTISHILPIVALALRITHILNRKHGCSSSDYPIVASTITIDGSDCLMGCRIVA